MIHAAIVGASGYAGGELLRLLLGHPEVEVSQITSERYAGQYAHFVHPNLRGYTGLKFESLEALGACDLLFLGLPHGETMGRIDELTGHAKRVIDLSADFRLRSSADYGTWYGAAHPSQEWLDRFTYGLPEKYRADLAYSDFASGPGCNAAVSLIALTPLMQRKLIREVVIDVKVGSSEGGNRSTPASHHPERAGVMRTYAPVGHRHIAELLQEFELDPDDPKLHFSVTSVGTVRGALATCHCLLAEAMSERDIWGLYRDDYGEEPFVRLVRSKRGIHRYPEPKILSGTNHCDIGFAADAAGQRIVVVAAIDNLMKGAAGNGVQVMNIMHGWPETMGLKFPGLHPA